MIYRFRKRTIVFLLLITIIMLFAVAPSIAAESEDSYQWIEDVLAEDFPNGDWDDPEQYHQDEDDGGNENGIEDNGSSSSASSKANEKSAVDAGAGNSDDSANSSSNKTTQNNNSIDNGNNDYNEIEPINNLHNSNSNAASSVIETTEHSTVPEEKATQAETNIVEKETTAESSAPTVAYRITTKVSEKKDNTGEKLWLIIGGSTLLTALTVILVAYIVKTKQNK